MKTSTIKMIAAIAIASLALANVSFAKGGNSGNHNSSNHSSNNQSSFKLSQSGSNSGSSSSSNSGISSKFKNVVSNNSNSNSNHSQSLKIQNLKPSDKGNKDSHNSDNHCKDGHCKDHHCSDYWNYCYHGGYCYRDNCCYDSYGCLVILCQTFEPFHSSVVVMPGDSLLVIAMREYRSSTPTRFVAQFNGLPMDIALAPGQTLMLPTISSNGAMFPSNGPAALAIQGPPMGAPAGFAPNAAQMVNPGMPNGNPMVNQGVGGGPIANNFGPIAGGNPIANNGAPVAGPIGGPVAGNTDGGMPAGPAGPTAPAADARPTVAMGSMLMLDGQSFGDKQGSAKLRVSGLSLQIEVVEWTTSSVKVRLPMVEVAPGTTADIEVQRADGSLATKTAVALAVAEQVAQSK